MGFRKTPIIAIAAIANPAASAQQRGVIKGENLQGGSIDLSGPIAELGRTVWLQPQ